MATIFSRIFLLNYEKTKNKYQNGMFQEPYFTSESRGTGGRGGISYTFFVTLRKFEFSKNPKI
jgi:hypothetical protein